MSNPVSTLWAMMNDPARAALWTALQDVLLVISAILVGWYLLETRKMRIAAQDQIAKSQELITVGHQQVTASYEQLAAVREQTAVAQDQMEGQIRPALVAQWSNNADIILVNIGNGPALHVQLSSVKKGAPPLVKVHTFKEEHQQIAFLEASQTSKTYVRCAEDRGVPGTPVLNGDSLQCTYRSLSGRIHYSVIDFEGLKIENTRFYSSAPGEE